MLIAARKGGILEKKKKICTRNYNSERENPAFFIVLCSLIVFFTGFKTLDIHFLIITTHSLHCFVVAKALQVKRRSSGANMTVTLPYIIHPLLGNESLGMTTFFFFFILPLPDSLYIAVSRDDSEEEREERFRHAVHFEVLFKVKKNQRCQVVALSPDK